VDARSNADGHAQRRCFIYERFCLEIRVAGQGDRGLTIHVVGDIAGQEVESRNGLPALREN